MSTALDLSNISATDDGGNYDCIVLNDAGFGVQSATLYVNIRIIEQPMSQQGVMGDNVTLTCRAESYPFPTYQWEKFNHTSQLFEPLSGENNTNLVLTNMARSDFGLYRCSVSAPIINNQVNSSVAELTCKLLYKHAAFIYSVHYYYLYLCSLPQNSCSFHCRKSSIY